MYNYEEICKMSLKCIEKINAYKIPCSVLTKGVLPKELANMSKKNEYGITLISLNEDFRKDMEPGSAPYMERIQALKYLHDQGYKTWVSIEPYPTPNIVEQNISEILNKICFVDRIVFGRANYNKAISSYNNHKVFYNEQAQIVIDFCKKNKIDYHIKNGTIT